MLSKRTLRNYALLALSGFGCLLLAVRIWVTDHITFAFLLWNLVLAIIPYAISSYVVEREQKSANWRLVLPALLWLLFFPNAPYILTDLLHLKMREPIPLWYDLILLMTFAWIGLLFGLLSLLDWQNVVEKRFGFRASWLFVATTLFLSSFGVYLGRFRRWNSWDLFTNPADLLSDVGARLNPFAHWQPMAMTFMFFIFLMVVYGVFRSLQGDPEADRLPPTKPV